MKWPRWPGRPRASWLHKPVRPDLGARRGVVITMLLLGLVVWIGPHLGSLRWQPWGEPAQRWTLAKSAWNQAGRAMTNQRQQALTDAHTVQTQVDACPTATVRCLQAIAPPRTAFGQLVLVQAWHRAIETPSVSPEYGVVRQGLLALDRLQVLGEQDVQRWTDLAQTFQRAVNACSRAWPDAVCNWWATSDEQTWGLTWDRVNNVARPPDDAQAVPNFVREHRPSWQALLRPEGRRSTDLAPQALFSQGPRDDPRAFARSDRERERPGRSPRTD